MSPGDLRKLKDGLFNKKSLDQSRTASPVFPMIQSKVAGQSIMDTCNEISRKYASVTKTRFNASVMSTKSKLKPISTMTSMHATNRSPKAYKMLAPDHIEVNMEALT